MAAEIAELCWLALLRDVPFRDFATHPLAQAAVADLRAMGFENLDLASLFRGETSGERTGPLISQFLWRDIPYGLQTVEQRFRVPSRRQEFLTTFTDWHGRQPRRCGAFADQPISGLVEPVRGHYARQQEHSDAAGRSRIAGQKAFYYHKWQVHRRARPEVIGGHIDVHLSSRKSYDLDPSILTNEGLARSKSQTGSWWLPQAYPEGSPTHPAYPAAHAVNAGACATVLKAFF
jgi:hypothetical protein